MITLENVGRAFGDRWAVRGLTLEVPPGEIFGLLGPNGAGKTTAMKLMTGLLRAAEGRIVICGHDVAREPLGASAATGYVPDRAFFYEKLTVREFLGFVAAIYGIEGGQAASKIDALIRSFEIKEIEHSLIEGCSQGMRQRVLFASALIHEPRALLIDEPFVGLDPFGVILIKDVLKGLSSSGVSVFLATHSLHIAAELCHRVGLIDRGKLIALKKSGELGNGLEDFFIRELGSGQ